MLYLYKYHKEPKSLYKYDEAIKNLLPDLALDFLPYLDDVDYDMIMSSPEVAYEMAVLALDGRFEEGEDIIATSGWHSYQYATKVIYGRFPKGEASMKKDDFYDEYLSFLKYMDKWGK